MHKEPFSRLFHANFMTKNKARFYLAIAALIILFDVVGALASKSIGFDYTKLSWISLGIYFLSGYFGCKYYGVLGGLIAGLVAGAANSTVGWALSSMIQPYIPSARPNYPFSLILDIIVSVSLKATFFGLIGALLRLVVSRIGRVIRK